MCAILAAAQEVLAQKLEWEYWVGMFGVLVKVYQILSRSKLWQSYVAMFFFFLWFSKYLLNATKYKVLL
jgi:hypothetical protein